MLSDVKLKIRHAKRGNERTLDLSNMGLSELPVEITQLTMLESLNLTNNKL
jgi:Leucine-rich repeat (LRR) protein